MPTFFIKKENFKKAKRRLDKKIDSLGFDMIHQTGFRGASGVIEYVRPEDILAILYRLKPIGFKER